jgi:hypothetical protein
LLNRRPALWDMLLVDVFNRSLNRIESRRRELMVEFLDTSFYIVHHI